MNSHISENTTALEFGDWLSVVDSNMGDLSYSSGVWWNMVKGAVELCYQDWLQKRPVDRLRLKPNLKSTFMAPNRAKGPVDVVAGGSGTCEGRCNQR